MIVVGLFGVVGLVTTLFYADKVEALVIKELNQKLSRPVEISDINFSFFKKFPKASVEIQNISVQGLSETDQPFIKADKLYLSFNLTSLIRDEMVINEITIEDANVNVKINDKGQVNYLIFKETKDTTTQGILNIEAVNLINTKIVYEDVQSKFKIKAHSFNSAVQVNLSTDKIISSKWDGVVNRLSAKAYNVENIPVKGLLNVSITDSLISYSFTKGKIITLPLIVNGLYERKTDLNTTSFELSNGELKQIILLLDSKTQKELIKCKLSGKVNLHGVIKDASSTRTSLISDFKIVGGQVQLTEKFQLKGVDINGILDWNNIDNLDDALFSVHNFAIKSGNSDLTGSGSVQGIKKLFTQLHLEGNLDIPLLVDNLSKEGLVVSSGKVVFNSDVEGEFGALLNNKSKSFQKFKSEGDISIEDLTFLSKEITDQFSNINGKIHFDNEKILLDKFTGKVNSSSFTLDGYLYDYLNEKETLSIDAKLRSDQLILEEFLDVKGKSKNDTLYKFNLPKNLRLNLEVAIGEFYFRKFKASEIQGRVVLADQVLSFNPVFFNSCEGDMSLKGRVIAKSDADVFYEGRILLNDININSAFYQMENFGQEFLLERHLSGALNSSINLKAQSDKELNMNLKKLFVEADVNISKGELKQFEPMLELQEFLMDEFKIDLSLETLKFKKLKNYITIANEKISIPEMSIASDGINLKMSGVHSFEHEINYLFKIKNKEIFKANKKNSIDEKYGVIENSDKTSTLPLLMTGTVDDPKFSYDLKAKKEIMKENWVKEGKDIKDVIKKEIKEILGKKDTTSKKENATTIKVVWDDED